MFTVYVNKREQILISNRKAIVHVRICYYEYTVPSPIWVLYGAPLTFYIMCFSYILNDITLC